MTTEKDTKCLLFLPSYGRRENLVSVTNALNKNPFTQLALSDTTLSLLAMTFNMGLCEAFANEATHYCLLHNDVMPLDPDWLVKLKRIMDENSAVCVSVTLPIKGTKDTSTAKEHETRDPWRSVRMSQEEVWAMPPTWEAGDTYLANSGCMLLDLRVPWIHEVYFQLQDRIVHHPEHGWVPQCISEDWDFTRQLRAHGGKTMITQELKCAHVGSTGYMNWDRTKPS